MVIEFLDDMLSREIKEQVFRDYINGKIYTETWRHDYQTPYFHKIVDVDGERCYLVFYPSDSLSSTKGATKTIEVNANCCGLRNEKVKLPINKYIAVF